MQTYSNKTQRIAIIFIVFCTYYSFKQKRNTFTNCKKSFALGHSVPAACLSFFRITPLLVDLNRHFGTVVVLAVFFTSATLKNL